MEKVYIYTLEDPITSEIRYVGKANNLENRFKNHLNSGRDKNTHKRNWINKLKKLGLKPIIKEVDFVDIQEWQYWECFWIHQMKTWGFNLLNHTSGGDGLTLGNQTSFKKGHNAKKIVGLDLIGNIVYSFNSIKEATKTLSISNISSVLKKETKTAGGYIWLYEEAFNNMDQKDLNNLLVYSINKSLIGGKETQFKTGNIPWNKGKTFTRKGKVVLQYSKEGEFINEFESCAEAARYINGNQDSISNCCRGKNKSSAGYIWKYKE